VNRQIICIFCGGKSDFVKRNRNIVVVCKRCNRKTDRIAYKRLFAQWLDEILMEDNMRLPNVIAVQYELERGSRDR
jgi:ribosomal protein L37AE/L43A